MEACVLAILIENIFGARGPSARAVQFGFLLQRMERANCAGAYGTNTQAILGALALRLRR
jgi:hypothetical protein